MTSSLTTSAADALLICETTDGVATLTLNRPGQFNALSSALIDEMQSMLIRAATDPGVRVVVLAARGRGFCAGHDLKEIRAMADVAEVEALFVYARPGVAGREAFFVPIDLCYALVGLVRREWRGFSGGTELNRSRRS